MPVKYCNYGYGKLKPLGDQSPNRSQVTVRISNVWMNENHTHERMSSIHPSIHSHRLLRYVSFVTLVTAFRTFCCRVQASMAIVWIPTSCTVCRRSLCQRSGRSCLAPGSSAPRWVCCDFPHFGSIISARFVEFWAFICCLWFLELNQRCGNQYCELLLRCSAAFSACSRIFLHLFVLELNQWCGNHQCLTIDPEP